MQFCSILLDDTEKFLRLLAYCSEHKTEAYISKSDVLLFFLHMNTEELSL